MLVKVDSAGKEVNVILDLSKYATKATSPTNANLEKRFVPLSYLVNIRNRKERDSGEVLWEETCDKDWSERKGIRRRQQQHRYWVGERKECSAAEKSDFSGNSPFSEEWHRSWVQIVTKHLLRGTINWAPAAMQMTDRAGVKGLGLRWLGTNAGISRSRSKTR